MLENKTTSGKKKIDVTIIFENSENCRDADKVELIRYWVPQGQEKKYEKIEVRFCDKTYAMTDNYGISFGCIDRIKKIDDNYRKIISEKIPKGAAVLLEKIVA